MDETECSHESAKTWSWGDLPRNVAQGWNWCEECGALLKVEKATTVIFKDVILPKRIKAKPSKPPKEQL